MTEHTPGIPLGSWLAELPDERLIRLLELRPDLAQPPPGSIAALAARAQARQSVKAATDELDFLRLAVLDALLVLQADTDRGAGRQAAGADRRHAQPRRRRADALDDLKNRALVWGEAAVRVAADAGAALPWHPGQVTLEDAHAHRGADRRSDRRARRTAARGAGQAARRVPDGPHPRRRSRRPDRPAGAAAAGDGTAATHRRRDGDPAPPRRAGAARRGARSGAADRSPTRWFDHHSRRRRRRGRRRRDRPAPRGRCPTRKPLRHTGCRAAQRRLGSSRSQAAGQGHRDRRTAAGPDPRGRGRGAG